MGGAAMRAAAFALLLLTGCEDERSRKLQDRWDGAVLVRVCRDGTHIFRLNDGTHRTGGLSASPVENPEKVCQ